MPAGKSDLITAAGTGAVDRCDGRDVERRLRREEHDAAPAAFEVRAEGAVAWLTFNRPQARNAMTWDMYQRLYDACEEVDADDGVRVLVICGRDEVQQTLPTYDEVYAQMNDERVNARARRYLRDLRRDAIIEFR